MISSINKLSIMRRVAAVLVCTACSLAAQASQVVDLGTLSVPGTYTYSNTFNAPTIGFLDDYTFTIPAANFDSITASLDLGQFFSISNLQARLYSGTGPFVSGTTPLLQAWSTAITAAPGTTGSVVVISPHDLASGPYTLELRGDATGSNGGSYSGSMNLVPSAPVPEPGSGLMVLAGIALFGFQFRRNLG